MSFHPYSRGALRRTALCVALGMAFSSAALAQSTTANVYGTVPAESGLTVRVVSDSGLTRTAQVDASGRYNVGSLPIGTYTVTLLRGEQVVEERKNVLLRVNSGTDVSFAGGATGNTGDATNLGTVTVLGTSAPKVDVTSVDSRTVITSADLERLPLGRSAEAIALLAPGAVSGSGFFGAGNTVSFGGAGVSENAYYINGFLTSNPLSNIGGIGLPYGMIDQQEVYLGGYSARYGRSDGGVINQIGKRGTNEWHFGGQAVWEPGQLYASPRDTYYPNQKFGVQSGATPGVDCQDGSDTVRPCTYKYEDPSLAGTINRYRDGDNQSVTSYSGYVTGPLIQDRLFIALAAETKKTDGVSTNAISAATIGQNHYKGSDPKVYAKIDWAINDSNTLEYTYIKNNSRTSGSYYGFDYDTLTSGGRIPAIPDTTKVDSRYDIFKYTGYLTDDLTLSATYGRSKRSNKIFNNANLDSLPLITRSQFQDPAITGGTAITNQNVSDGLTDGTDKTRGLRADLEWRIGDHTLTGGVDNMHFDAINEGTAMGGNGFRYAYFKGNPNSPINSSLGVGPPGGQGYYVSQRIFITATNMSVAQDAYFLEDRWQVSDNFLLSLGVRNDRFTNKNSAGESYVESGSQWAPRLGASWDVMGDSSLKIYANLGRYYLALPNSVAIRGASASTFTNEYFSYTGIAADGTPTGLTALGPGPVSANGEYGQAPDAKSITATDLKSQYQDEAILGFDKTLGSDWVTGVKLTYRKLQTAIDDICDPARVSVKLAASGIDPDTVAVPGCVLFNPGGTNTFSFANTNGVGRTSVTMTKQDWGFEKEAKRNYAAVNLFLEHPFDGKWQGRVDYTWSRNFGNTEGQLKSDIGQTDVSKTQDWDAAAIMRYAGGLLANDRRHQLKFFGAYQIADEWIASAAVRVQSGTPKSCLGYYSAQNTDEGSTAGDPIGYTASYHTCFGEPSAPGESGETPWTKKLDLGVSYRPSFADKRFALNLQVFNVLNEQKSVQDQAVSESGPYTVSNTYNMPLYYETPRYVQVSASYDF